MNVTGDAPARGGPEPEELEVWSIGIYTGETLLDRRSGGILALTGIAPVAGRHDEGAPPDTRTRVGRRHFVPVATTIR